MTIIPKINRRSFLVGAAAAGGGLSLGFHIPFGPDVVRRPPMAAPEINAWVVIKPDDTVVIRIARSEMGQGTLTGLAQLVAEELECDWSKVTTEYPTPGQNVARNRVWGNFSTGGSRGIRESHEYVRKGGAAAREMLIQAAANEWKVPGLRMHGREQRHHAHALGRTTTYGKVAEAAAKLEPPQDVALKDPKDWKIAGKPMKRLDTAEKLTGKADLRRRRQAARHAQRRDQGLPGLRRQGEELRRREGRKACRASRRSCRSATSAVAVIADTWWHAKTALDALPIDWDEGPNAKVSSATIAAMLKEGLDASAGLRRQPEPATSRPRSPARPRRSRRSTAIRTRTTRRWSR